MAADEFWEVLHNMRRYRDWRINTTRKLLHRGEDALYKADGSVSALRFYSFMIGLVVIDFMADRQMMELILEDIGGWDFILFMTIVVSVMLEALPSVFASHFMKKTRNAHDNIVSAVTGAAFIMLIGGITVLRFATVDRVFDETVLAGDYSATEKYVITAFLALVPLITSCFAFGISCAVTPERRQQHVVRLKDAMLAERYRELLRERSKLRSVRAQGLLEMEDELFRAQNARRQALVSKLVNLSRLKIAAHNHTPENLTRMEEGGQ